MEDLVGLRFCPTDSEIVDHYLRLKNLGDTPSYFDKVMNTLNICSFDPWDLPPLSRIRSEDNVWYFFSRKKNKYERGERQSRKTKSGFWKITGKPMKVMGKSYGRSPQEKMIGEKKILVFNSNKNLGDRSKSDWVMHEYHSVSSSPTQKGAYTICRVEFKGEASDISFSGNEINRNHSFTATNINNSERLTLAYKALLFDLIQELENSSPLSGFPDVQQPEDVIHEVLNNLSSHSWESVLDICNNSKP